MDIKKTFYDKAYKKAVSVAITSISDSGIPSVSDMFNFYAENELPYQKMSTDTWKKIFITGSENIEKYLFRADIDGHLVGFTGGCRNLASKDCYITFILVDKKYRRKGIGRLLLKALEQAFTNRIPLPDASCYCSKIQITFFNP